MGMYVYGTCHPLDHHLENVYRWFNCIARITLKEIEKMGLTTTSWSQVCDNGRGRER